MSAIDDVARGEIEELKRTIRALQNQSPLERSSVSNGRLRFIGGELRIDSGGQLIIKGTLSVDGTSTVTGTFTVSGPWNLTGNGTITGSVSISGPVTISGNVNLTGIMTVTGDIVVSGAGKIKVGSMTLDPSANGGSMKFSGGPEVYASGAMLGLYSTGSGGWIELDGSGARLNFGVRSVRVTSSGIQFVGLPTIPRASANMAVVGTVWSDTSGNLYRVVL